MFTCSRLFGRVASSTFVCKLNLGIRNGLENNCISFLNTNASILLSAATNVVSSQQNFLEPIKKKIDLPNVKMTCCGFPKKLVNAPSCVVDCNNFGDDACFTANYDSTFVAGVADGVGGWRKYGINPSEFSSRLMKHCCEIVEEGEFEFNRPDLLIAKAFNRLKSAPRPIGSSTACVLIVHQKTLYSANLGDSGYLVYRNGKIIYKSKEQVHYFNAPFQLTLLPDEKFEGIIMDKPEQSELYQLDLKAGDVIVLATDGLWDNVPENIILDVLTDLEPNNLQATCNSIALIARRLSHDEEYASPFALKAGYHGIETVGGKPDDITLVLLYVS